MPVPYYHNRCYCNVFNSVTSNISPTTFYITYNLLHRPFIFDHATLALGFDKWAPSG